MKIPAHPLAAAKALSRHKAVKVAPLVTKVVSSSARSLRQQLGLKTSPTSSSSSNIIVRFPTVRHRRALVIGHRGSLYEEMENTRASFQRCVELNCDGVELDVFKLKDDTLIVFHAGGTETEPGDLSEYCVNAQGRNILDLTYEQALQLEFNPHFKGFVCTTEKIQKARIPTLEQVLRDLKPTGMLVKVELKGPGTVEPVLKLVEKLEMVKQCQFSSKQMERLQEVRALRPQKGNGEYLYATGAVFSNPPADFVLLCQKIGAGEVHLRYDQCTVDRVEAIRKAGMKSMAWFRSPQTMKNESWDDVGNEDEACYEAVMETGVDQLCVNRPNVILKMLVNDDRFGTINSKG